MAQAVIDYLAPANRPLSEPLAAEHFGFSSILKIFT